MAIADCDHAIRLNPGDTIVHFTGRNAHIFQGRLDLARADFEASVQGDPS